MKCWGPCPAQANQPPFKVKWTLSLALKHAIYCNLYCSSGQVHQPGRVVIDIKQETVHAVTILKLQDKRRSAVEETNIGNTRNLYWISAARREVTTTLLPDISQEFRKGSLAEITMKLLLKVSTVLNQGFTESSPASANHFKQKSHRNSEKENIYVHFGKCWRDEKAVPYPVELYRRTQKHTDRLSSIILHVLVDWFLLKRGCLISKTLVAV